MNPDEWITGKSAEMSYYDSITVEEIPDLVDIHVSLADLEWHQAVYSHIKYHEERR